MSDQDTTTTDFTKAETFTDAAFEHGEKTGNDDEIEDLKTLFSTAFDLLTPQQRTKFVADAGVRQILKSGGVTPPEIKVFTPTAEHDKVPVGTPGVLMTKSGVRIRGTNECLYGTAGITSVTRNADGTLEIDFDGETDVSWDSQQTETNDAGEIEFLTEGGDFVYESDVIIVPEGYDPTNEDNEEEDQED